MVLNLGLKHSTHYNLTEGNARPAVLGGQQQVQEGIIPEVTTLVVVPVAPAEVKEYDGALRQRSVLTDPFLDVFYRSLIVSISGSLSRHVDLYPCNRCDHLCFELQQISVIQNVDTLVLLGAAMNQEKSVIQISHMRTFYIFTCPKNIQRQLKFSKVPKTSKDDGLTSFLGKKHQR